MANEHTTPDQTRTLRILESWLPLAQEANLLYGWQYDYASLENLVLRAAPALDRVCSALDARVILWHYHRRAQSRR